MDEIKKLAMLCGYHILRSPLGGFHGGFRTGRMTTTAMMSGDSSPPHHFSHAAKRSERRVNRFDDQSGLLHKTDGSLSREHRRQLFMLKAKTEEDERKTRALLFEQHYNKCAYLRCVIL